MGRRKRASMREGPLADLFRSTVDDPPADPPEAPIPGKGGAAREQSEDPPAPAARESEESVGERAPRESTKPRWGREEPVPPVEHRAETPQPPAPSPDPAPSPQPEPPTPQPEPPSPDPEPPPPQMRRERLPYEPTAENPSIPQPRERLRKIFGDSGSPDVVKTPRWGREEPQYQPATAGPRNPIIRVIGVGGAGVNAVNRMVETQIPGVEFMAVNTDLQSLQVCTADVTVHIGAEITRGLGSGSDPGLGHRAAFDEQDKIKRLLKGSDMVFVAAGAGGGTGTGAAPVVARLAREVGALTVGIVTRPFSFEGSRRAGMAEKGIETLAAEVDTLIVVPNDRLLSVLDEQTSMVEAFEVADDVLRQGVQGVSDLVTLPALINLDFADVRTIMSDAGQALLGIGMSTGGEGRAMAAAEKAISSPLLETSVEGARSILLSITGGADLSLVEVSEAAKVVGEAAHPDANIIFGANIDEELTDQVWVTVVATRFDGSSRPRRQADEPTIRRTKGERARPRSDDLGGVEVPEFLPG
jgi:cell division protein FtsZ